MKQIIFFNNFINLNLIRQIFLNISCRYWIMKFESVELLGLLRGGALCLTHWKLGIELLIIIGEFFFYEMNDKFVYFKILRF